MITSTRSKGTYRLRVQESETRIEAVQSELKKLQQAVEEGRTYS